MHGEELVGKVHDGGGETCCNLEEAAALLEQECLMLSMNPKYVIEYKL